MKLQIGTYLKNNVTTTSLSTLQIQQRRTRVAVYLIVTSPFFSVQR